jgi:hypothetical protein
MVAFMSIFAKIWGWILGLFGSGRRKWFVLNGVPVQYDKDDKPFFWFPNASPGANYLQTATNGAVRGPVIISYSVETTGSPIFDFHTNPNNTGTAPSSARIMVQRRGDDFSGSGGYEHYRFWSTVGARELAAGSFVISSSLDPAQWISVYGKRGSDVPADFAACMSDAEYIGVTFGGGSFYGHGVFVRNGSAMFRIDGISY